MREAEVLAALAAEHPHDRLRAARAAAESLSTASLPELRAAIARESVPWVKNALEVAREAIENPRGSEPGRKRRRSYLDVDESNLRDVRLQVSEEMASTFLHEIRPRLGAIRMAASREISSFAASETLQRIEYLEGLLQVIADYRSASQAPAVAEFDLPNLIDSAIASLNISWVSTAGKRPFIALGDARRVEVALMNGLNNAAESVLQVMNEPESGAIAINWDEDDRGYWVSIVDRGIGLRGSVDGMFGVGRTTKEGHYGMGLPIAKQAMLSVGGDVTLGPSNTGGARLEIVWPKGGDRGEVGP